MGQTDGTALLEAHRLTKSYTGVRAVTDLSFSIHPGAILGCLGPNGSGKSTTVKMLTGLLDPTSGRVLYRGRDINDDLAAYKARLGYAPEGGEPLHVPDGLGIS